MGAGRADSDDWGASLNTLMQRLMNASPAELRRLLLAVLAAALAARIGTAILTDYKPLFPPYYYADSKLMDEAAWSTAESWRTGEPSKLTFSLGQRLHSRFIAAIYYAGGHHPLLAKLVHCLFSAAALCCLAAAVSSVFGAPVALLTTALVGGWPTHVFFSSQALKDPLMMFFAYAALAAILPMLRRRAAERFTWAILSAGVAALLAGGFLRSYVLIVISTSLTLAAAWIIWSEGRRPKGGWSGAAALLAALAAGGALFIALYPALQRSTLSAALRDSRDPSTIQPAFPTAYDARTDSYVSPLSPGAISYFRDYRQSSDRQWAKDQQNSRRIGTQLFPGLRFETWGDVASFLPKGSFFILFMPLPGLYPLEGNLGRILAAGENLLLLLLAILAVKGMLAGPMTAERAALLMIVVLMTLGSALLEFDLGSAARHKTFYLPLLFPFSCLALLGPPRLKPPAP